MFYVYIIFDPEGHIPRYVGKGSGLRVLDHYKKTHNQQLSELLKDRDEKDYCIIETPSEASAFAIERFWIAVFGREDLGTGSLFNLNEGGDGASHSPEQLQKISKILKEQWADPEFRASRSAIQKKAQNNEITRQKKSLSQKGKPRPYRSKKCSIDGGITVYNSFKELCKVISRWKAKRHPNFQWIDS